MIQAIENRRSIRKYSGDDVPREQIEQIIRAGMLAPSSKNRQPWKFVVATGDAKEDMLATMRRGLDRERVEPLLPESAAYLSGAKHTWAIMKQTPVVILIVNPLSLSMDCALSAEERIYEICNAQSVGAAIENMTLTAAELGLGSLWICDTFFAQRELNEWLGVEGELMAALAVGIAAEAPPARPRKKMEDVVEWR